MKEKIKDYMRYLAYEEKSPSTIKPVSYTHLDVYKRQHL